MMQTAKQINAPLVGESTFQPNLDPAVPPKRPPTAAKPAKISQKDTLRAWCLANLRGPRADVIARVNAAAKVPAVWRAAIVAEIMDLPEAILGVVVHAHCHQGAVDSKFILSLDISKLY